MSLNVFLDSEGEHPEQEYTDEEYAFALQQLRDKIDHALHNKDPQRGLYGKYIIEKADGTPVDPNADYFVLRLDTDPAARAVMWLYIKKVKATNRALASDLRQHMIEYYGVEDIPEEMIP